MGARLRKCRIRPPWSPADLKLPPPPRPGFGSATLVSGGPGPWGLGTEDGVGGPGSAAHPGRRRRTGAGGSQLLGAEPLTSSPVPGTAWRLPGHRDSTASEPNPPHLPLTRPFAQGLGPPGGPALEGRPLREGHGPGPGFWRQTRGAGAGGLPGWVGAGGPAGPWPGTPVLQVLGLQPEPSSCPTSQD